MRAGANYAAGRRFSRFLVPRPVAIAESGEAGDRVLPFILDDKTRFAF